MSNSRLKATVFIPVYNGDRYLKDILQALVRQKTDFAYEVLIIDSGSRDKSVSIAKKYTNKYPNFRFHDIPNSEYGHGKTRNLAARMAGGEIVAYLSHDAIPAHDRWLYEIVQAFSLSPKVVAVMGKQIPRAGCFPLLKYEIDHVFNGFGPDFGTTVFYKDSFMQDQAVYGAVSFYSDVNSAACREVLMGDIPYRDVRYAEDQLFGRDVIEAGLYKAYAPRASVVHSNDLLLSEYRKRMFDETLSLRRAGISTNKISKKSAVSLAARGMVGDTFRIVRDKDFSWKRKLYWLAVNPLFHIEKWRGVYTALAADLSDELSLRQKHSLEEGRKV